MEGPLALKVDLIDTWRMTGSPLDGVFVARPKGDYRLTCEERPRIALPGQPYMALRFRKSP